MLAGGDLRGINLPRTPVNKGIRMDRSGTQLGSGIERRQECPRPWRTREATPEKVTEGVMMNTSKANESAPMIRVNMEEGRSGYTLASIEGLLERAVTVGQIRIGLA